MTREYPTLLDLVGGTPVVRLLNVGAELGCTLLAKLEYMTPGGSNKDRIGLRMVEAAERDGKLEPGGTIVEPTSGNTGVGLALAAAVKGYKLICVVPDKVATEKIALLRAFGAEVVICPTAVDPDSPESYYSVSDRLAEEIPGAYKPDQYSNQANPDAHYHSTGPEIWEQVGDDLDAIVISVGTGGSISGIGRYLKEQKPELVVVGADPEGSVFTAEDESGVHPYLVEGIGKDTFPETFDPSIVDEYVRVSDRDSFLTARRLAREEGILGGGSAGTSVFAMLETARRHGPGKTILTTIPDGGRGYLSKLFDDNWMLEHGLLERRGPLPTIDEVLAFKHADDGATPDLVVCEAHQKIGAAIELMQRYGISQLARRPARPAGLAHRRHRLAQRARAARPRVPQSRLARRRRRRRHGPAAARGGRRRVRPRRLRQPRRHRRRRARRPVGRSGRRAHAQRPPRVPRARSRRLACCSTTRSRRATVTRSGSS